MMKYHLLFYVLFIFSSSVNAQNKFENLDVFELQYARDPQISPDGSKVVYIRTKMDIMKDGKSSSLWIMNSDGTNHQKLTSLVKNESNLFVSLRGNYICKIEFNLFPGL